MAQLASKRVQKHKDAWWQAVHAGQRHDPWWERQSEKLQKSADEAWDKAEAVSMAAGHPFKNRHGENVTPRPRQAGILERVVTELQQQIEDGELEWPPPPPGR